MSFETPFDLQVKITSFGLAEDKMCTQKNEITNKYTDSDVAMLADEKFQNILHQINDSKLNYCIQLSPFTACISIKKSFIKDKDGA